MAINERLIDTAVAASGDTGTGNQEEGLILHLDANDVDSYDGDGTEWIDIKDHEYTPATNVSEHFNTVTFGSTGVDGAQVEVDGVGFQPDLVWIKSRNYAHNHRINDSVRGVDKTLKTNTTGAELSSDDFAVLSFNTDGFDYRDYQQSDETLVAWCWKAGGAAVSNTDGDITSQVSANVANGFSIVKWSGDGSDMDIGHGLDAAPEMVIRKNLISSVDWTVDVSVIDGSWDYLKLNTTAARTHHTVVQPPTSTTFNTMGANYNSSGMIAYCFASKRGVSKVGSYTGTGAVGNKVYTGFEPAFVMVKRTNGTGDWMMHDNKRSANNGDGQDLVLYANLNNSEDEYSSGGLTFDTDGFTINVTPTSTNLSGGEYIYYAVAKDTNETSLIPDTDLELHLDADSFPEKGEAGYSNTPTTWTALTGSNGTITGATFDSELGNYLDFDGSNDFVATNHTQGTSTSFTFESWINTNNTTSRKSIIGDGNSIGADTSTRFFFEVNGDKLRLIQGNGVTSDTHSSTSTTSLSANTWHHVSATISGTSIKFYIDGTHTDSFTSSFSFGTAGTQTYTIGAPGDYRASLLMDGQIGQVRMYDAALTEAQIRQNYNFTKPSYPNGYDGTISGATWNASGYFDFDGSNDYVSIPSTATSPIDASARNFTFSMWINRDSTGYAPLITKYGTNTNTRSWYFQTNASGQLQMGWWNGSSIIYKTATSAIANTANQWYHVALAVNASTMDFYVDGVLKNSLTGSVTHRGGGNEPIIIGSQASGNYNFFNGQISKVKIHDKALTGTEITALYNEGE